MVATSAKRLPLFIPTICYVIGSVIGILIVRPTMVIPAVTSFSVGQGAQTQYLFPMLFVIVACGAVSGFHFWLHQAQAQNSLTVNQIRS